jgi:hypothetical protein
LVLGGCDCEVGVEEEKRAGKSRRRGGDGSWGGREFEGFGVDEARRLSGIVFDPKLEEV